jgi:ATP-dependent RNA helicase DeaD
MRNPESISLESYIDAEKLKQIYYDVQKNMKFSLLVHLLKKEDSGLVMVFCNTRHNTDFVGTNLNNFGIDALVIHGGLNQKKRNSIMEKFHHKKVYVLICTDIAARGLDIKGVSHVYNYDIPKTSKEYIHRIGRTARAGKNGIAINLLADRDYENFRNVLKDPSLSIEKKEVPQIEMVRITLNPVGMHRRERWNSSNWKDRKAHRTPAGRRDDGNQKREERRGRGDYRRVAKSGGRSRGRNYNGGGRRSGNRFRRR